MLKSLTFQNFRGFSEHRIEFCPETILIGQNNAGKTTAIEGLRVLSVCQTRASSPVFIGTPSWLDGHCQGAGYRVSLETIDFDFANVQHAYDTEKPAIIRAKLRNNSEIHIYVGRTPDQVFCQLHIRSNRIVHSRSEQGSRSFGLTRVMPPVGSLLPREKIIAKDRLNRYLDGYLAYRHFRNQLWERPADYRLFRDLLEGTWQGLKIQHFENDHGKDRNEYSLLVREGRFTCEVSWHGHGLQAWMQTVWFLSRVSREATIVLDEPDVYLHADLQRKLIKLIESLGFRQAVMATHSSEIIGDVPFQNVTVVRKQDRVSRPAQNAQQIQSSLKEMGSLHSIQLSKLAGRGLLLFVEGDDKAFLSDVAYRLGSRFFDAFTSIAVQELKGKGNWGHAIGAAAALSEASNGDVQTVMLLDSDYMLEEQRLDFLTKARRAGLFLKIWRQKEIESYFINSKVMARYIRSRTDNGEVSPEEIEAMIVDQEGRLKMDITLSFSDVIQQSTKPRIESKTAYRRAEALVAQRILGGERLSQLASGKDLIGALSEESKNRFGVSFTPLGLCKETQAGELPAEMTDFVRALCEGRRLTPGEFEGPS